MSRTIIFRKGTYIPWWADYSHKAEVYISEEEYNNTKYDTFIEPSWYRGTIKYKKIVRNRKYWWLIYKDRKFNFKEPGPRWFRNIYNERPFRRLLKLELKKFSQDSSFEVSHTRKPKLDYWT